MTWRDVIHCEPILSALCTSLWSRSCCLYIIVSRWHELHISDHLTPGTQGVLRHTGNVKLLKPRYCTSVYVTDPMWGACLIVMSAVAVEKVASWHWHQALTAEQPKYSTTEHIHQHSEKVTLFMKCSYNEYLYVEPSVLTVLRKVVLRCVQL